MSDESKPKVVINLTAGDEDAERVTIAFLVGTAALGQGKDVVMFLTKDAVRLTQPGYAEPIQAPECPPMSKLFAQFAEGGGRLFSCPFCMDARGLDKEGELVENATVAGATPLWEWVGDEAATVFSY